MCGGPVPRVTFCPPHPSLRGPPGRAARSVTARGVDCAGGPPPARYILCHPPAAASGSRSPSIGQEARSWAAGNGKSRRHADTDTNVL